jgi:naphthoate synthase
VKSYIRLHDDLSSEPSEWRAATDESRKPFIDVIYKKAVGEGITMV